MQIMNLSISVRKKRPQLLLATCAIFVLAQPARSQSANADDAAFDASRQTVEEVVVTARRREENINEVPMAISAFTADDIAKRNIENMFDVARYTPGFSFEDFAGGVTPAPVMRGLTQNTLTDRNQNVGTFINGIHVQQQGNIDFRLMDVQRIEVLKGPQNSQYGRSAFAGAINYVPFVPDTEKFDTNVSAIAGSDERLEARGSINVPLWENKLALRVYGAVSEFDGVWDNTFSGGDNGIGTTDAAFGKSFDGTDGNTGGWDNDAYHVQLRFQPSDSVTMDIGYYKSEINNEQSAIQFVRPNSASVFGLSNETNCNQSAASGVFTFYCGELTVDPDSITVDPRSVGLYAETELTSFNIDWAVTDNLSLSYLGGWNNLDSNSFGHTSNPPNPEFEGCGVVGAGPQPCAPGDFSGVLFQTGPTEQKADSHEFRIRGNGFGNALVDQLSWTLGYYYADIEDTTSINSVELRRSLLQDPGGQQVVIPLPFPSATYQDTTNAFIGAIGYSFADIYKLDVEARYAAEEREQTSSGQPSKTFYSFTPRVSLSAQVLPETMIYGTIGKGSKAGGFNTPTADPGFETYDPETNVTYELGAKQTLLDGTLQLNYDIFYVDWKDLQLPTADLIPSDPSSGRADANFITNASGATSWGVELDAIAFLWDHWDVNFAASYTQTEFDNDALDFGIGAQCAASANPVCPSVTISRPGLADAFASPIGGNELPRQPSLQLGLGLGYTNMIRDWTYSVRGDLSYQDKQYLTTLNLGYLPDRTLLDLTLTFDSPDRVWSISVWGKNVTDEDYVSNSFVIAFNNTYAASLGQGATYGITGRFNFDGE